MAMAQSLPTEPLHRFHFASAEHMKPDSFQGQAPTFRFWPPTAQHKALPLPSHVDIASTVFLAPSEPREGQVIKRGAHHTNAIYSLLIVAGYSTKTFRWSPATAKQLKTEDDHRKNWMQQARSSTDGNHHSPV